MSKLNFHTETMQPRFSALVKKELDPAFSRKAITLAPSDSALPFGLVLSLNKQGQYGPYAVAGAQSEAAQQSEAAPQAEAESRADAQLAILLSPLPASKEAQTGLGLVGHAVINMNALVWDASVSDQDAARAGLERQHFILKSIPVEEAGDAA